VKASVTSAGFEEATAVLRQLGGDLPGRALADALNHTANQGTQALVVAMTDVFADPTPFTLNAVRIFNATPNRLEAALWVKDEKDNNSKGQAPEDWVAPEVFGGQRALKKSEAMMRAKGILPAGRFIAPGAGARLDRYGNISRGQIVQILSGLSLFDVSGYTGNASLSKRSQRKGHGSAFFVIRRGKTAIGIAERRGERVQVVLAFVRQPHYRNRLDFHGVVERVAEQTLATNVDKAVADALTGRLPTNFRRRPQSSPG